MWIWITLGGVLIVAELLTTSLIFASISLGAFTAAIAAALGADIVWQSVSFAIVGVGSIFGLRPLVANRFRNRSENHSTNALALIGAKGKATTEVTQDAGQVKVRGEVWSAKTENGRIAADSTVEVKALDGVTLIVTSAE